MTSWAPWYAFATLLFALLTAGSYFSELIQQGLKATIQLALLILIATGSGRVLLRVLGLSDISESQKTLIGATVGFGLLSLGTFSLAAAGWLNAWSVFGMLALLWIVGFFEMRAVVVSLGANRNLLAERPLPSALILGLLSLTLWMCWVPPHQYDSLTYHLALPQLYLREGGLVVPGYSLYAYFPQNAEMLFSLALLMRSDLLAQMLMWLATSLTVWWIFEMGKREAPLSAVLLSCLMICSHTAIMLLSSTVYIEPLLMLWQTAAVLSYLRWRQLSAANPQHRSWLILSAVFTGLALGAKYTAGFTAGILFFLLLGRWLGRLKSGERAERFKDMALYAGIVAALFSPWLIKNAITVGNPFFPFFYKIFPMTGTGWTAETAKRYFAILITEYGHEGRFWKDLLTLPVALLTNPMRFGGGMDVLGGLGWSLVFWSFPVGVWASWKNKFLRGAVIYCLVYIAAWFLTGVVLRFLTVLVPLLALVAGCGIYALWHELGGRSRVALISALAVLTGTHVFLYLFVQVGVFGAGQVLLGMEDRHRYLSRRLDYYPCARYAAEHLDKNDKIVIVGEQRGYYVEQGHLATTVHAPNRYALWANEVSTPEALAAKLRAEGFRALLTVPREEARLQLPADQLDARGLANWQGLKDKLLRPIHQGPVCGLYAIGPQSP
ncbi:MAG: phospholipid carrier-dependent glycosyltransferase [Elusimicrobia bacterium]|nr:phospholipid carrier-dependent glycosyltransferase [Elusimicrobiota bacterium]